MPNREYGVYIKEFARISHFPVRRKANGKRGKRCKPTSEAQEKLNQKNREYRLMDILHLNYTHQDYVIRLSYEIKPENEKVAKTNFYNYIRKLNYYAKKNNLGEIKYIHIPEIGVKSGNIHHHVIINGIIDRDTLEKMWEHGYANSRRLQFNESGLIGLSRYMNKSYKYKKSRPEKTIRRAWNCSRNLDKPKMGKEIRQNDYRVKMADVAYIDKNPDDHTYIEKLYPGYFVVNVETTACDYTVAEDKTPIPNAHFITLFLCRKDAVFLNKKNK